MSFELPEQPIVEIKKIKPTNFTEGFVFKFLPPEENDYLAGYKIYASDIDVLSNNPNINNQKYFIKELNYSSGVINTYFIPKNTGNYFFQVFSKSKIGFESSGISFSGQINNLEFIKEINFKNVNFYAREYNSMIPDVSGGVFSNISNDFIMGWEFDFYANTTDEFRSYFPETLNIDLTSYITDKRISFFERIIPNKTSNNLLPINQSFLKDFSSDVRQLNYDHTSPTRAKTDLLSYNVGDPGAIYTSGGEQLTRGENTRFLIYNSRDNLNSYILKNTFYVKGVTNLGQTFFDPNQQTISGYLQEELKTITGSGEYVSNTFIKVSNVGYYDKYYAMIEAVDFSGNSSAGGNIYDASTKESRYTNPKGYKLNSISHVEINRGQILELFREYKRETADSVSFIFKKLLPVNLGLESVIIFPEKFTKNINNNQDRIREDNFIFIDDLSDLEGNISLKNYPIERIDDQTKSIYKLTVKLSPDSLLPQDTIFSMKVYYLNALQTSIFSSFVEQFGASIDNDQVKSFIDSNNLIDKYITLTKCIKQNPLYTSTIAASYQGLVYFFTPESYQNISWPDAAYCSENLNNRGARMLDFVKDGFASGPQFFNYFPRSQSKLINNIFPSGSEYNTTYRCLDSYKYSSFSSSNAVCPEDVPSSGINSNPAYLGVWDPGNIGDIDSPEVPDFKYICDDLKLFSAKNIYSVKVLSVGTQKDDAYSIVEFVLDIPDAEDFIVQGISGTDSVLEKGIKQINGVNYHYFIAKFISSCGINNDPILNNTKVNILNVVDSKKIISFITYPTKQKIFEDESDKPSFGRYYLFANDASNNQFMFLKACPTDYVELKNSTDCVNGCCVTPESSFTERTPYKPFYILSSYNEDPTFDTNLPYGKIMGAGTFVIGSLNWRFLALDYSTNNHIIYYKQPTVANSTLYTMINFLPEHDVALYKIAIYIKQTNDISITSNDWSGSELVDTYQFDDIVKSYPIMLSLPDFKFSRSSQENYINLITKYSSWINNGQTFAVRIVMIDRSADKLEQTFVFVNQP